jgi:hypothetical protein
MVRGGALVGWLGTLLALGVGGCEGPACGEASCGDTVDITVKPQAGDWEPGSYSLQVKLDDNEQRTCNFVAPRDVPASGSNGIDLGCVEETGDTFPVFVAIGSRKVENSLSIKVDGAPQMIDLTLTRDGQVVLQNVTQPVYAVSQPNGPECSPTCHQASYERSSL